MTHFADNLKKSIHDPTFYQNEVRQGSLRSAFSYFLKLIVLCSFIATIFFSVRILPVLSTLLSSETIERVLSYFPQDLTVTIDKGIISTNGAEPVFIDISHELNPLTDHFIVIDTKTPVSLHSFNALKTTVWVAKTAVVTKSESKVTIQSTEGFPNLTINQASIRSFISKAKPFFKFTPGVAAIAIFVALFITYLFYLLYLLIFAFIIMFVAHLKKIEMTYGECYRFGLYAITLPVIINLAIVLILGPQGKIPFLFSTLAIIVTIFNLKEQEVQLPLIQS